MKQKQTTQGDEWVFFPRFLIKTIIGFTHRGTIHKAQFLSPAHIHNNRGHFGPVQQNSVGCIKMKGAVRVSLTESEKESERGRERQKEKTNTQGLLNYG